VWQGLWLTWRFVRQVSGDDAYERYLAHHGEAHATSAPMTREQFYKFRQEQKWDRITRCC
jgi:uncharacterized short protein YbdD (DUF466 family)